MNKKENIDYIEFIGACHPSVEEQKQEGKKLQEMKDLMGEKVFDRWVKYLINVHLDQYSDFEPEDQPNREGVLKWLFSSGCDKEWIGGWYLLQEEYKAWKAGEGKPNDVKRAIPSHPRDAHWRIT